MWKGRSIFYLLLICTFLALFFSSACAAGKPAPTVEVPKLALSSQAFADGEEIPTKYTCDGEDVSPPLSWEEPPQGTQSLVLIMDDPDAPHGVFNHWVIYNLPPDTLKLSEAVPTKEKLPSGAFQGKNGFGRIGYAGPCPPPDSPHRYEFVLYALDKALELGTGASKKQVLQGIEGHILAKGKLTGTYQR